MSFDICVYIDRELDLQVVKTVRPGMPLAALKGILSQDETFGGISSSDILLALTEGGKPLSNAFALKGDVTEMYIVNGDEVTDSAPAQSSAVATSGSAPAQPSAVATSASSAAPRTAAPAKLLTAEEILAARGEPRKVLGLSTDAGSNDIRKAYHRLSLQYHPDKAGSDEVFRAVSDAYQALTSFRAQEGGWADLEGQAVGPFTASPHGVTRLLFDCFGAPPWESRRLYTGSWAEGKVKCWELSQGEPGKVAKPPRLLGEIEVAGFLNDMAAISPHGLLTAQSAGYIPQPGESMRGFDIEVTPFQVPTRATTAIADGNATGPERPSNTSLEVALQEDGEDDEEKLKKPTSSITDLSKTQMVYLHGRGCRKMSLWPRPEGRESYPRLVASISKDALGVSKISTDGCGVDQPAMWKQLDPHEGEDANSLLWAAEGQLLSGANDKILKLWDVEAGSLSQKINVGFQISGFEVWMESGVVAVAHTGGIAYVDLRTDTVARNEYKKKPVTAISCLKAGHPMMFVGLGADLMQYDTRCFADGISSKPKPVATWTLQGNVWSVHTTMSRRGNLLVACGDSEGKVAAFDTT